MKTTPGNQDLRKHTITWQDPKTSARNADTISGIDYLRAILSGKVQPPPAAKLIGYKIAEVKRGGTVFELEPAEYHYNPFASVHGGIACTLLDTTMTAAVLSTLEIGYACSTTEMKVNFIRPISARTGKVRCEAETIHVGRRLATASAKVFDSAGKLYAHGVNTCMIFRVPASTA